MRSIAFIALILCVPTIVYAQPNISVGTSYVALGEPKQKVLSRLEKMGLQLKYFEEYRMLSITSGTYGNFTFYGPVFFDNDDKVASVAARWGYTTEKEAVTLFEKLRALFIRAENLGLSLSDYDNTEFDTPDRSTDNLVFFFASEKYEMRIEIFKSESADVTEIGVSEQTSIRGFGGR